MNESKEIENIENKVRLCNRCNKLLKKCVADEARCSNCNGIEFRWEPEYVYKAFLYHRKKALYK